MQRGSFTEATPRHDATGLVQRLNALASRIRDEGGVVVFVQHAGALGDAHHPSEEGFEILPDLAVGETDFVVSKSSCDAFLGTGLDRIIDDAGIGELIITGCATDYCVDTTIRAALTRGYRTTAPSDGHTTADRPHLLATMIIEHHNVVWSNFLSPAGPARVCSCEDA
jgi:nicotinamidase-related amidase